jgi:hypothetical protein
MMDLDSPPTECREMRGAGIGILGDASIARGATVSASVSAAWTYLAISQSYVAGAPGFEVTGNAIAGRPEASVARAIVALLSISPDAPCLAVSSMSRYAQSGACASAKPPH